MKLNKISTVFTIMIVVAFLVSCSKDEEADYMESLSPITSVNIADTVKIGKQIPVNLISFGSSGCSQYSRYDIITTIDTTEIIVYQKRPNNSYCTTEGKDLETTVSITFTQSGKHFFKFKQWDSEFLLDSVYVSE